MLRREIAAGRLGKTSEFKFNDRIAVDGKCNRAANPHIFQSRVFEIEVEILHQAARAATYNEIWIVLKLFQGSRGETFRRILNDIDAPLFQFKDSGIQVENRFELNLRHLRNT